MKKPSVKGAWHITIAAALNAVGAWRQYAKQAEEYRGNKKV